LTPTASATAATTWTRRCSPSSGRRCHPWPRLQLPNSAPPAPLLHLAQLAPAPSRRPWFRSPRFALAASLALLIGGYALMSAALTPPAQPDNPSLTGETANTKWNKKDMEDQDPIEDENLDVHEWLEQGKFGGTYHMELTPKK